MLVRDIMTRDVVTIPPDSDVLGAKRILDSNHFRRLPVVEKGKLVGLVTTQRLERFAPTRSGENIGDIVYTLVSAYRTPVQNIMQTNVVTVTPTKHWLSLNRKK